MGNGVGFKRDRGNLIGQEAHLAAPIDGSTLGGFPKSEGTCGTRAHGVEAEMHP